MSFERFKKELRKKTDEEIQKELEERQKTLFKWNYPAERIVDIEAERIAKGIPKTTSKHPYDKIRKEIAIIKTIQRENEPKTSNNKR